MNRQSEKILISIIIPIYNVSKYLKDCLDSCLSQTYQNLEIICVDDGSSDGSGEIVDSYNLKDSRFKVIHKTNGGLPSARKAGIEAAKGEFIFHLDGDDNIPCDAIRQLVNKVTDDNIDMVVGDYNLHDSNNISYFDSRITQEMNGIEYVRFILIQGLFNIWGRLIRRSVYIDNSIQIPLNISIGEDLVATMQLAYYSRKIVACKFPVYNYYIRTTSMSKVPKGVTGALSDRVIFAVEFVLQFLSSRANEVLQPHLTNFIKQFVYQYMQSPYPVSMRRNELKVLVSYIEKHNQGKYSFRSFICEVAHYNLNLAKNITKLSRLLKRSW